MKASYSSIPRIKTFSSVDYGKYLLAFAVLATAVISVPYFFKSREKNKNDYK